MDVEIAQHSGFCYGVKEAIKLATETAEVSDRRTVTFGPLIHNPQEIERLGREYGIERVDALDGLTDANVVIRAHGVPPEEFERAAAQNLVGHHPEGVDVGPVVGVRVGRGLLGRIVGRGA